MKRDAVDFFLVADHHMAIHQRLEDWARWVKVRPHGWQTAPMFRQYRPAIGDAWWGRREPRSDVNIPEALEIEKAVSLLPEKHREAIRWAYVWRDGPVVMAKRLGVGKQGLCDLIAAGRTMLVNQLRCSAVNSATPHAVQA